MSNPAFQLIGLDALRNDPRYIDIDGNAPDRNSDGQPDQRLTVVVLDTGVDTGHQLLSPNILAYVDFINNTPVVTNNPPTIASANSFSSPENTTDVSSVIATDPEGSPITFSIVGGADEEKFQIDSVTGALTFRTAPDFENPGSAGNSNVYALRIQVGDGQNVVPQDITITVTDVSEVPANQPPSFTSNSSFTIDENNTAVGTVTANDPDGNPLSFSISGGGDQNRFTINASNGSLSFVSAPDYETPRDVGRDNVYNIQVSVFDGQNTVTQDIAVTVNNSPNERVLLGGILSDNNDPDGHGTHVSGIIGATDPNIGVANNVDLIGLRVLGEGQDGTEVTQALQWVLDHRAEYNIVAVNMSLGIASAFYTQPPTGQTDPLYNTWRTLIQQLEEAGVTVVSAAGNNYDENHLNPNLRENISIPAIASTAAVGAVWQDGTVSNVRWSGSQDNTTGADRLVSFSQRLSTFGGMLFAPGAIIESTLPGNQIGGLGGTSMAAPMVSGVVALMQDAALTFGDRLLTPDEIRQILLQTADTITDGDDEDTNVTPTGSSYLRIDVYDAVQAVDRLLTGELPPEPGDNQFFRFVFNSNVQTDDFYQGYGYAVANTYQAGASVQVTGGTYTITEVVDGQAGNAGEVVVTDYYDGSTGFGYAIYVDANGSGGLGSESGFAYDSNFGGPDTFFSSSDTADLQQPPVSYQIYYFTYYYNDNPQTNDVIEGDNYQGYGYAAAGTYTQGQIVNRTSANETGGIGYYKIDAVYADNYGLLNAVSVYSYYDGADGNGTEPGGSYGYASYIAGYGYGGLGTESGYAYDYNYASTDAYFSPDYEANLSDGVIVNPLIQLYYFTYTYGNGDSYQGWGYADANTYQSGQVIPAENNELGLPGQYVIDWVWESYGAVGRVEITSYNDGADGNGSEPGGGYGSAYYVSGSGYEGLGTESGYAYDYNYTSTDVFFSKFDEANLVSQLPTSQIYYFKYSYGNGDFYQGYGYAPAGTYTQDQVIQVIPSVVNEVGLTGQYVIEYVYDTLYNYSSTDVYVTTYYDGGDGNGAEAGGGYGYASYAWGYGDSLGSESGYAYDHNYQSSDTNFSSFYEANLVNDVTGENQLYYFTYQYGNGDFYKGYGYAATGTYIEGQQIDRPSTNETGATGYYTIDSIYSDSFGYLGSIFVNYYYDADTGYGPAFSVSGSGSNGLGSESGTAYDASYLSTDTRFDNYYEADLVVVSNQKQLYYFTYYYGNNSADYYQGYGYAAAGTYTQGDRIDQTVPNETGATGYYLISSVSNVSYGSIGQVSVFHYNDVDTNYGPAYSVWAEGYNGLGSEYGYAYDYYYSSPDNYFSNYYEADLGPESSTVDLYYFTYYYGNDSADYYQGYGYAVAGTYTQGQRIDQTGPNETGATGYYLIDAVYGDSSYSSTNTVYVYNYYDRDTGYGWAWSAWGQGYDGLGSESGYAYDYNYITTDPQFGRHTTADGTTRIYEADLLASYGTDTNPTLATATNLGTINDRDLSTLTSPTDTTSFQLGSDPTSDGPVPADVDMYRFELTESGTISLQTSLPSGGTSMDTILRLFDVYGNELGTDDDTGPDFYSRINAYLTEGAYYFGVSGYANFSYSPTLVNSGVDGSTGDYAISIAFDPDATPFIGDPNGTATNARDIGDLSSFATFGGADVPSIIGLDTDQPGVDPTPENLIAVGDKDIDLIKFTAGPGLVIFQTSDYIPDYIGKFGPDRGQAYLDLLDSDRDGHFDDQIDSVLRLFDASGNELAMDDDGGEGLLSRLEYVFAESGTYYLGISGHGNSTYNINTSPENVDTDSSRRSGSTGSSLLSIILQQNSAPQDPNGVLYGAIPVDVLYGSNLTLSEEIGTDILAGSTIDVISGDVDLYRFTANESGVILIDLDTTATPGLDTYLRIFDANGIPLSGLANDNAVARDFNRNEVTETGTNSTDSFVRLDVTGGNIYYIGVSASGNQTYNLTDLNNRTNPSTGDYQINLQYGGGGTSAIDGDGYINANLPSFNLTQTNTGNRNLTSLQKNIGNDAQVEVGATDVDFVKVYFEGQSGTPRILTATTQGTAQNSLVPTVYVFDGTGNQLSASTSSSGANTVQLSLNVNTDYYVAVASYGNENFNSLIMGSGIAADTGNYTLDLSLSGTGTDRVLLTGILNAANLQGSLYGNSLDFDIDLFGTGSPRRYTLGSTESRTILASLGEDVDQFGDTAEETNAFGRLYIAAQGLTGTAADITANSSDVGADDVDIYPINITEAGIYRFTTSGTGIAIDDARPTLKIFDAQGAAVSLTDYGPQGVVTGNVLADLAIGDYYLVVMSTGTGTDQFAFGNDPGFETALTEAQLREFYQNTGNYQLDMSKATLSQPNSWVERGTSFAQRFSLPLDVASLQLYGASGISPSLSVTGPDGSVVAGSLVYDEDNNTLRFVPTNPILAVGEYTITYSDPSDFRADGANVTAGNLQSATFNVPVAGPVVYLPSFARGPGQPVNINGTGIPVKISDTDGLTNIRITVDYDADALNITGAQLASELTGWEIVGRPTIANGRVTVDLRDINDTVSRPLPPGDREVIRLIADVPDNAVFNSAEVIEVSAGARAGSRRVAISDSTSVQKVAFFGNTNEDAVVGTIDAFNVLILDSGLATGFDNVPLLDPSLMADITSADGSPDGVPGTLDAFAILVHDSGITNDLLQIPDGFPADIFGSADPTISISQVEASPGQQNVTLEVRISAVEPGAVGRTLQGARISVTYDTTKLNIAGGTGFPPNSPDVDFTSVFPVASENVNDTNGTITVSASAGSLVLAADTDEVIGRITFDVVDNVSPGTVIPITLVSSGTTSTRLNDGALTPLVLQNGSITIAGGDPSVTLAVSPSTVTEDGTDNLIYTFTRTGVTSNALTVNYTVGGTATNGTDYSNIGTSVTFAANSSTATVTVDPTADTTVEADETVSLTLVSGNGYTIGTTSAVTGTITNDDTNVTLAVSPSTVTEDGTGNLIYTFTRTGVISNALAVNYTVGGTATSGTDYSNIGTSVTFAANSSTATVTADPTADTTVESDETVSLTLDSGTGYTLGTTSAVTGTITNDDTNVTLAVSPSTVTEDGTDNLIYTFTRTGVTSNELTVNYTVGGTATNGTDYGNIGTSVTFAANSSTATVTVDPTADTTVESDETVSLTLDSGTGYTIGTTSAVTGTITNDDTNVTLAVSPSTVTEDGTDNLIYTFTRTGVTSNALTVNYTVVGTATNGTDYSNIGTSVTFAANSSTATVTVDPTADTTLESDETVSLTLDSGNGYTIGTTSAVTGTITNDDTNVTLAVSPSTVTEDGTANLVYTFTRTGVTSNALAVNYTVGGTATSGTDYSNIDTSVTFAANSSTATVTVDPTADTTVESDETVSLTLDSGTGYTLGTTSAVTGTITNDDTNVTLAVSPSTVTEDGSSNLIYTFTRTGVISNALTVNYTVGGTAINGIDYGNIDTSVTFAANSSTATVTVDPTTDTPVEGDETVSLTLASGTGYTLGTTSAVTGTITEGPTVIIAATDPYAAEIRTPRVNNGQFTLTLSEAAPDGGLAVNYTVSGTATAGQDYTALPGTVTIAAGQTTALLDIIPVTDAIAEGNQSVIISLTNGTSYNLGATNSATVTIVDGAMGDIDGNGKLTGSDVFLIKEFLGQQGSTNLNSQLENTLSLFPSETVGATNTTGVELASIINSQLSLFDIDGNGTTSQGDIFLINQYLLLGSNSNLNPILEQVASAFGSELNGPNNTGVELNQALGNLIGSFG